MAAALTLAFALSTAVCALMAVIGWQRRHRAPAFRVYAWVGMTTALWSAVDIALLHQDTPRGTLLALGAEFPAICGVVAGFFCLSLSIADRAWRLTRRTTLLLMIEPALVIALIATNPWHHWFFTGVHPTGMQGAPVPIYGPAFWAHAVYSYVLLAGGTARIARAWWRSPRRQRRIYTLGMLATLPPVAVNVLSLILHETSIDMTGVGYAATAVIGYWVLARRDLPSQITVANRHVLETILDAVTVVDLDGVILDANPAAGRLLRRLRPSTPSSSMVGRTLTEALGRDPGLLDGGDGGEYTLIDSRGTGIDLHMRVSGLRDRRGDRIGWVLVARDITELNRRRNEAEEANAQLREQLRVNEALRADLAEQAVRDALTGLHNRRHLMNVLAAMDGPFSLVLLDIDHFKRVNDTYGHAAGDDVLVHVSRMLTAGVRHGDLVARHGGEEFVLLLAGATAEDARVRVDHLRERIAATDTDTGGHLVRVTFSAGVAGAPAGRGHDPTDLLSAADKALYSAKRLGRNRVELATGPIDGTAVA